MAREPLPIIDPTRCTGCARCIDVCPTQALTCIRGKAALQFPERCTYCTACEDVCPENAIALPFIIVMGPYRDGQSADTNEHRHRSYRSNHSNHSSLRTHDKGVKR